jgi:hypothetical protein
VPSDGGDEGLDINERIATSVAACQNWFAGQTGERRLRFDSFQGLPDITFFRMSRTDAQLRIYGNNLASQIDYELLAAGFNRADKIYAVYYGGGNDTGSGSAAWPPIVAGHVAALYLRGASGPVPLTSSVSVPGYWEFSLAHEILHALGFVPTNSPHFFGAHVTDDPHDVMYAGPLPWQPATLDAGHDDYFEHGIWGVLDLAQSAFLDPLTAYPVLPPSWPLVDLKPLDASQESSLRSINARNDTSIRFVNASGEVRRVYWIDYSKHRQLYAILQPWQAYTQPSYLTMPWVVTNTADQAIEIFLSGERLATAVMRLKSPQ